MRRRTGRSQREGRSFRKEPLSLSRHRRERMGRPAARRQSRRQSALQPCRRQRRTQAQAGWRAALKAWTARGAAGAGGTGAALAAGVLLPLQTTEFCVPRRHSTLRGRADTPRPQPEGREAGHTYCILPEGGVGNGLQAACGGRWDRGTHESGAAWERRGEGGVRGCCGVVLRGRNKSRRKAGAPGGEEMRARGSGASGVD